MKQYEFMKDTDENGNDAINVSYKPRRKLDFFPRLICLFFALVIWLWMVNFNDTDVTETMTLDIEYVGLEALEKEGMMIYGMDKNAVTITVKGSNRDIRKHEPKDYKAIADVSTIEKTGAHTLSLTVQIPSDSSVTVEANASLNVSLLCDLSAESTVDFDVLVSGVQDGGLINYSYESEQSDKEITIKGPKPIIDMISYARLNVNGNFVSTVDDMTFTDFPIVFLDSQFNEVNDGGTIEYSTKEMEVKVSAIAHKNIPINVMVRGEGRNLPKKLSVDSVEIWGKPSLVRTISSYPIALERAEAGMVLQHEITGNSFDSGINIKENIIITISFEETVN